MCFEGFTLGGAVVFLQNFEFGFNRGLSSRSVLRGCRDMIGIALRLLPFGGDLAGMNVEEACSAIKAHASKISAIM
jgi:hypothetical protein